MLTYVLYAVALGGLAVSWTRDREKTRSALGVSWRSFTGILPQFSAILVLIGLALAILAPEQISELIGAKSGIRGILVALAIGGATLIPAFVAFPLAAALLKAGAGVEQIAAFVSSLMMVGVVTLPMEMKVLGKRVAIERNLLALAFSLVAAFVMGAVLG